MPGGPLSCLFRSIQTSSPDTPISAARLPPSSQEPIPARRPRPLSCVISHQQPRKPEYRRPLLVSLRRVSLVWLAQHERRPADLLAVKRGPRAQSSAGGLVKDQTGPVAPSRLVPSRLRAPLLPLPGSRWTRVLALPHGGARLHRSRNHLVAWYAPASPVTVARPLSVVRANACDAAPCFES